jgi:prophage DNA circulation protein
VPIDTRNRHLGDVSPNRIQGVRNRVNGVGNRVKGVRNRVKAVGNRVNGVSNRVKAVGNRVKGVGNRVKAVSNRVNGVGNRVKGVRNRIESVLRHSSGGFSRGGAETRRGGRSISASPRLRVTHFVVSALTLRSFTTSPPFITNGTSCRRWMLRRGSPSTAMRSA